MERDARVVWIAAVLGGLAIVLAIAPPFLRAWRCLDDWSSGEWLEARVVPAEPEHGLVVMRPGGEACTVAMGPEAAATYSPDETVSVVARSDRPGRCELQSTVEASEALLVALAAVVVVLLLLLVLIVIGIQRLLTQVPELTTRFDAADVPCPRCGKPMEEGYLPLQAGLPWRRVGEPVGLVNVFHGLPGTVAGLRARPRVHAYRCEPCEVVSLRYGS